MPFDNSDPTATFPDFSESCVLADHVRSRPVEHYINLPRDSAGLIADKCPLEEKCVLTAILNDLKTFSSKSETDANRLLALENLGHWVGDIHQPMHVSFLDDRGGNTIRVSGCARNLHAVWDRCLVEHAVGLDAPKAVAGLIETIKPELRALWIASSARDWANETFMITKASTTGYCVADGQSCASPSESVIINTEYIEANKSLVKTQLIKAGVRLAYLLDIALRN